MTAPLTPIEAVLDEVGHSLAAVGAADFKRLVAELGQGRGRWFCTGQGRSGLVAQMAAMRLVHLGTIAHVVGESTAPAISSEDTLLVLSASGTTPLTVHVAEVARDVGAHVLLVTASPDSPLRRLADTTLEVPTGASTQFGGSLFEQSALLVLDAAVLALVQDDPAARAAMARRHANLQ